MMRVIRSGDDEGANRRSTFNGGKAFWFILSILTTLTLGIGAYFSAKIGAIEETMIDQGERMAVMERAVMNIDNYLDRIDKRIEKLDTIIRQTLARTP